MTNIKNYYTALNNEGFDANKWFAEKVSAYISKSNITPDEINRLHRENTEFVNKNCAIQDSSFTLNRTENEINYFQFECNFTCYRTSKNKYQSCNIQVEIGINSTNDKFTSYKELKVSNLKFTNDKP